jgi:hypothetical protein
MINKLSRLLLLVAIVGGITVASVYRDAFDASSLEVWVKN